MKRIIIGMFTTVLTCMVAHVALADDDRNDHDHDNHDLVQLRSVPQAARKTIEREVKKGTITEIQREESSGQRYFEVEFTQDGKRFELHVAEDGKLLMRRPD